MTNSLSQQRRLQGSYAPHWHSYRRIPNLVLPFAWRSWVLERGSLTKRLIKASAGQFQVRIVRNSWSRPSLSEARRLGVRQRQLTLIREVELLCFGKPWVYARSVIPVRSLNGPQRQLKKLGTKPLGAHLFTNRTMSRDRLEIARLPAELFERPTHTGQFVWGRRSVFHVNSNHLLVSEIFLPRILQHQTSLDTSKGDSQ